MAHSSNGKFNRKHPLGTQVADSILQALKPHIQKGKITCLDAHAVALEIGVRPQQIGIAVDLCEARIVACQLGLFGGDPLADTDPQPDQLPLRLEQAIIKAHHNNRIACLQAWQMSDTHGLTRLQMGNACDTIGIKITRCQLGAF